jgi:cytochrome c551
MRSKFMLLLAVSFWLLACNSKQDANGSTSSSSSTKFQQYYIKGEQVYLKHCSNCHQKNGKGLGLLYPPLDQSDFLDNNFNQTICLIRNGKTGELVVNGKSFNKEMPANPSLTDLEIAEVATYLYNTWQRDRGIVEVKETTTILNGCK